VSSTRAGVNDPGRLEAGPAGQDLPGVLLAPGPDTGGPLRVRRAAPVDRTTLARMFARCTSQTRYERFHGHVNMIPDRYLAEALSGSPVHYAIVACADADRADGGFAGSEHADRIRDELPGAGGAVIVALASCRAIAEGVAELGILVEDRWQRHGIGGFLLHELIGYADRIGIRVLKAQILSEQAWIVSVLQRYGTCHRARAGYGTVDVTLRLRQ